MVRAWFFGRDALSVVTELVPFVVVVVPEAMAAIADTRVEGSVINDPRAWNGIHPPMYGVGYPCPARHGSRRHHEHPDGRPGRQIATQSSGDAIDAIGLSI